MPTSSIDDLLMGGKTPTQPQTPEHEYQDGPEEVEELEQDDDAPDYGDDPEPEDDHMDDADEPEDEEDEPEAKHKREYDEYGNEKERMPKGMKDRLDRKDRAHQQEVQERDRQIAELRAQLASQGASQQVQKAAKDFEYDPDAAGNWQQQLAQFVRQEVSSMTREQEESHIRAQDQQAQVEFEGKFRQGMSKFHDFADVIGGLGFQISNPMTLATRGMADPAAFLYAAAKRNPGELERISKLRDPYAQMTEIGKLEERMRKNKPTTKAPRPLERTRENASIPAPKKKSEPSIEDLIAHQDAKKLSRMRGNPRGRR